MTVKSQLRRAVGVYSEPAPPVDLDEQHRDELEAGIAALARASAHGQEAGGGFDMLEQPMVSTEDLGKITAEAVKTSYEATAQAIARLGIEASERVTTIEQLKAKQETLSKACLELAEQYRAEGERQSKVIEEASKHLDTCQDWIAQMRKKLNGEAQP